VGQKNKNLLRRKILSPMRGTDREGWTRLPTDVIKKNVDPSETEEQTQYVRGRSAGALEKGCACKEEEESSWKRVGDAGRGSSEMAANKEKSSAKKRSSEQSVGKK